MAIVITRENVQSHKIKRYSFKELLDELNNNINNEDSLENIKAQYKNGLKEFKTSIVRFENSVEMFNTSLDELKSKIIDISIDIAKEVVSVELTQHSVDIAIKLGSELINELQNSSKIDLRVNPKDYETILEYFGQLNYVKVIADDGVDIGGIVATGDNKEVDTQILKRFEKVKKVVMDYKNI